MAGILLVPIHLDALLLPLPDEVVGANVDFTRLPFFDGARDVNFDTPYLSEAICTEPLQDRGLRLRAGVHLHWALPDALTHARDGRFPPAPNRWLVSRSTPAGVNQWIVESDYLYPARDPGAPDSVAFPIAPKAAGDPPFRFCGRKLPLALWAAEPDRAAAHPEEYLPEPLTAVGYGDPTFAALYANCRNIFGLHDDYVGPAEGLRYEVLGWYSDPSRDCLQRLRKDRLASRPDTSEDELLRALRAECRWFAEGAVSLPDRMICYARLSFERSPGAAQPTPTSVSVGNTSSEALAALLGHRLAPRHKALVEHHLEAVQLGSRLAGRPADARAKFREARHEQGFAAVDAGLIWSVLPRAAPGDPADSADSRPQVTLPAPLAHQLNLVNRLQDAYDRAGHAVEALRMQLFADWYKYLLCAYPPLDQPEPYADQDEARAFLAQRSLPRLQAAAAAAGSLTLRLDPASEQVIGASSSGPDSHAGRLAAALNELCGQVVALNRSLAEQQIDTVYSLTRRAAPRFWRPAEPVVLLAGDAVRPSHRHGYDGRLHPDGLLPCDILAAPGFADLIPGNLPLLHAQIDAIAARGDNPIAFRSSAGRPWNPLLLEWMVEFFPTRPKRGGDLYGSPYPHGYIDRNYTLGAEAVDLRHGQVSFAKGASVYRGVSILTPHAGIQLDGAIDRELARLIKPDLLAAFFHDQKLPADGAESALLTHLAAFNGWAGAQTPALPPLLPEDGLPATEQVDRWARQSSEPLSAWRQHRSAALARFYAAQPPGADRGEQWLHAHLDDFLAWYQSEIGRLRGELHAAREAPHSLEKPAAIERGRAELAGLKLDCQLVVLRAALLQLAATPTLAQALSGFNDALLMRRQRFQLPVADPLGFADDQRFAASIAAAVCRQNRSAPQPLDDFNPIRAGALNLLRLRLIDSFGQARELAWSEVAAAETLHPLDSRYPVALPPRIVQPARLNMRFLAADRPDVEMNERPASSPICGWLLANHLDQSLLVYDQGGKALGAIVSNPEEPWQPAPGPAPRLPIAMIANRGLRQVVRSLVDRQRRSLAAGEAPTFLDRFLAVIDSAMEHIEPDFAAHHQNIAMLIGRPLAVVRAVVDVQLQGPPAIHQSWSAFRQDMRRAARETHRFERVRFPIRLGEHRRLNDGLVGYWRENDDGLAEERFYAPQSEAPADDYLVSRGVAPIYLAQAPADPAQTVCMLLDPRGVVHAACGIAPAKALDIPPDQYQDALRALEMTFLTAPLLTERGTTRLSLPNEPGYAWSWLERTSGGWTERASIGALAKADLAAAFGAQGEALWGHLLAKGWIKALAPDRAGVVPNDQRAEPELGEEFRGAVARIELLLAQTRLTPFQTGAALGGAQELREGWLKLRIDPHAAEQIGTNE
jgi:hypothetical protein